MVQTISIIIRGKVQGVFFRQSSKEEAIRLGITGFVKNLDDGSVKIVATGTEEKLLALTNWCKTGPPKARVSGIEKEELDLQSFIGFKIER